MAQKNQLPTLLFDR